MKKLVFMLIATLSVALTSCSWFDSEPIEPKILGTGCLQYEAKSGTWFVIVDSTQFTVADVSVPGRNPRALSKPQSVEPAEGMLVTVFTSPRMKGVQAVTGELSADEIEKLYLSNSTTGFVLFALMLLCVIGVVARQNEEIPEAKANAQD